MGENEYIERKNWLSPCPAELKLYVAADIEALITDVNDEDKVPCWLTSGPRLMAWPTLSGRQSIFHPGKESWSLGRVWAFRG